MKLRLSLGNRSTNAKPFKIQYKKFLFWHDFMEYIEGTDGFIKDPIYYSLEEGKAQMQILAEGLSRKTKSI